MAHVKIRLINGGLQEYKESDKILVRLSDLKRQGYEGKELIHQLLTDDWGAPPTSVEIQGRSTNGQKIRELIKYE